MKRLGAVTRFVTFALIAAGAALGTGAFAGSPATPAAAQAAEATQTGRPEPELSIQSWSPEPEALPSPAEPEAPAQEPDEALPAAQPPRAFRVGDSGPGVRELEERLQGLGYDPGVVNDGFDQHTRFAVVAFQKVAGLKVDGLAGPAVSAALNDPPLPGVLRPDGAASRVEVDLGKQLMVVYREDRPVLITHISTGTNAIFCSSGRCRRAETPQGSFRFVRHISGWRTAELGRIYNPVYFTDDGVAVHGSASVPLHPASHGCVRIPMHTADLFPKLVSTGTEIHVLLG